MGQKSLGNSSSAGFKQGSGRRVREGSIEERGREGGLGEVCKSSGHCGLCELISEGRVPLHTPPTTGLGGG